MTPDMDWTTALLREAAATQVLPHFRQLAEEDIQEKTSSADLVTVADLACEAFLNKRLLDRYPGSVIIGEEAAAKDESVFDALDGDDPVWIIDPIDGTWNFAHGNPRFAIILALVIRGQTVAGWILDPVRDYAYTAEAGSGAHLDGALASVMESSDISEMTAVLYVGKKRTPALYDRIKSVSDEIGDRRFTRCAAAEYMALVSGRAHYAMFTRLLPWDHAAGVLIHAEAGGHGALVDGRPYRPVPMTDTILLAPDEPSWTEIRDFFVR